MTPFPSALPPIEKDSTSQPLAKSKLEILKIV